jgi:hypothetical protein
MHENWLSIIFLLTSSWQLTTYSSVKVYPCAGKWPSPTYQKTSQELIITRGSECKTNPRESHAGKGLGKAAKLVSDTSFASEGLQLCLELTPVLASDQRLPTRRFLKSWLSREEANAKPTLVRAEQGKGLAKHRSMLLTQPLQVRTCSLVWNSPALASDQRLPTRTFLSRVRWKKMQKMPSQGSRAYTHKHVYK